jgi:phage baseplate assembly protein W
MATVRLDNLIKPRIKNFKDSNLKNEYTQKPALYTDLSLDMTVSKSIGSGLNVVDSNDILVSNDDDAIRNSLYNIFTTKKGQKILNPEFGASLDQYLFDKVNNFVGQSLGQNIFDTIKRYEPRINIISVDVYPFPDLNQYNVKIYYRKVNGEGMINLKLDRNGLLNVE